MKSRKLALLLPLMLIFIFSFSHLSAASSVKTVALKVPFPDVGG